MRSTTGQRIADSEINTALQRAKQLAATNGGQKRTLSDNLNFYPSKREKADWDNENMASLGMGASMNETLVDTVDIPESSVGLVIGRGGEQIQMIQQQSSCRVQMAGESGISGFRQCTLQGPRPCIDKAKQLISDVLERGARQQGGQGGMQQNGANLTTIELSIPGNKCGLIIGKNGETIKGLQEQLQVKMMLIQDNHQVTMGAKPLQISGLPNRVEQAKNIIENLLNGDANNQPNLQQTLRSGAGGGGGGGGIGPRSIGEVIVPRSSVGIIIGKGGDTIKRLAAETGAKIQFKPDDPNLQERCAIIQGTPEQINHATAKITELVTRGSSGGGGGGPQQQETFYMHVPANKTGLVIGKGGDTIKQISAETGAHVELSRSETQPPNASEKVFVIRGTPFQIHHVQHIIRIKVGDLAPGTPLPPFHGTVSAAALTPVTAPMQAIGNPYGPNTHAPQQFNAAPAHQQVQDPSVWNQYYNQQQQAGFANAAAAPQPTFGTAAQHYQTLPGSIGNAPVSQAPQMHPQMMQQQPGLGQPHQQLAMGGQPGMPAGNGPPAINPATGQPDYSAQWAEYYRTMGMHDQAAMIEQQMKQAQVVPQQRPQQQYMQ